MFRDCHEIKNPCHAETTVMTTEHIDPFRSSAVSVFDTMLSCKIEPREPYVDYQLLPDHEVSGIIGLSGKAKGAVVLNLSRNAAISISEALLGQRPETVDRDVIDAVGELTNIIAGSAKAKLEHLELHVSLPTVIVGKGHAMAFPHNVTPICIPFDCPWGPVAVEVGLIEHQ
jgi:chemotaxis protein CheX